MFLLAKVFVPLPTTNYYCTLFLHYHMNKENKIVILPSAKNGYSEALHIYADQLQKAVLLLDVIEHPIRCKIVRFILTYGEMSIVPIFTKLHLEREEVAYHLNLLRRVGVVVLTHRGDTIYYDINGQRLEQIENAIHHFSEEIE